MEESIGSFFASGLVVLTFGFLVKITNWVITGSLILDPIGARLFLVLMCLGALLIIMSFILAYIGYK